MSEAIFRFCVLATLSVLCLFAQAESATTNPTLEAPKAMQHVQLAFSTPQLGNIFLENEAVIGTVSVLDPAADGAAMTVTPVVRDVWGAVVATLTPVTISQENSFRAQLTGLPGKVGFYTVEFQSAPSTASNSTFSYAVLPVNTTADKDYASPFGVGTHFNQGWDLQLAKIVKRAGIAWIRDTGVKGVTAARDNKLCFLAVFDWHVPIESFRQPNGEWDFTEFAGKYADFARKYDADIAVYDFLNEPNNAGWTRLGGSWDGGPWITPFILFGKQVSAAIRSVNPKAKIMWEDGNMLFCPQFVKAGATKYVDIISPHPYNGHRTRPLPEENDLFKSLPSFFHYRDTHKLKWEMWSGEFGYSSYQVTDPAKLPTFYSPNTELHQAQLIARMAIMQLAQGVNKVFVYDLRNDGNNPGNPEHNFGLIHNDATPKPSLVAYSNLIYWLSGCQWLGTYVIGGGGEAYAFRSAKTKKSVLVAWLPSGVKNEVIYIPSQISSVTVTDVFGGQKTYTVKDHWLTLPLSETPIFVEGLDESDIAKNIMPNYR